MSKEPMNTSHTLQTAKVMFNFYRSRDIPAYISGPPGVGKSDMVKQSCAEEGIGFKDVRLANKLPEDIGGIPTPDLDRRIAIWLRAEFWPDIERHGKRGILFFDEMSDANKALQSCAYQIVLDRKINDYQLPDGWYPCAAGNRREDRAAAQTLSTALANRFGHIDIRPDADTFYEWATSDGAILANGKKLAEEREKYVKWYKTATPKAQMGFLVPGFIKYRANLLHSMEGGNLMAFPTPRSWANVARLFPEDESLHPTVKYRSHLVAGLVGAGAAAEFEAFMKQMNLPNLDEILGNPAKCRIPKEPANKYALTCMLSRAMNANNIAKLMLYITRPEYGRDFEICTVLDAAKRDGDICDMKEFVEFAKRNEDLSI